MYRYQNRLAWISRLAGCYCGRKTRVNAKLEISRIYSNKKQKRRGFASVEVGREKSLIARKVNAGERLILSSFDTSVFIDTDKRRSEVHARTRLIRYANIERTLRDDDSQTVKRNSPQRACPNAWELIRTGELNSGRSGKN